MAQEGVASSTVKGLGFLIVATVVVLVVVSTLIASNLLQTGADTTTVTSESGWLNSSGYTLTNYDGINRGFAIVKIINATGNETITSGNYTLSSAGVLTNASATVWNPVKINYTYIKPTTYEVAVNDMGSNMTYGLGKVSAKIPTILIIIAVILLLGVLALVVRQSQGMGLGNSGGSL